MYGHICENYTLRMRIHIYAHIRIVVVLTSGKRTMFKLCNYDKDMVWFLGLFWIILLFMKLILLLVNFSRTIRTASIYFVVYALFLFMDRIGMSVVPRYWSLVDMSEGCCWCHPSSVGTLTRVNSLEYVCWSRFATDYTYVIYIGNLFWGEDV
jgi:hypothetical protein